MTGRSVEERAKHLRRPQAHVLESLVDEQLVEGQLVSRDVPEPSGLLLNEAGQLFRFANVGHQADTQGGLGVDSPPRQQKLFGVL